MRLPPGSLIFFYYVVCSTTCKICKSLACLCKHLQTHVSHLCIMKSPKASVTSKLPQATLRMRAKRQHNKIHRTVDKPQTEAEVRYYDNQFRKWHYKLALIILITLTAFFMIVLNLSSFFIKN